MKNTDNEELCELMFSTQTKQEILNDERRKNELTQLDLKIYIIIFYIILIRAK